MAEEESKTKMVVPKDVIQEVKEYSKNHNIPFDTLKEQLRELYFGAASKFAEKDGMRARQAMLALKAQLNARMPGGETIEGIILHMTYPSAIIAKKGTPDEKTMQRSYITGIFAIDKKKSLIKIAAWDEAIDIAKKIPMDKVIRLSNVFVNNSEEFGKQYTMGRNSTFTLLDNDEKDPSLLLEKMFAKNMLGVEEFELKPSKDKNDKRLIKARVKDSNIVGTKKGNILALYRIYDDSVSDSDLSGESSDDHIFSVRCDASFGKYLPGSLCLFLGTISAPTKKYSASMFAEVVVPVLAINKNDDTIKGEIKNAEARAEYLAKEASKEETSQESTASVESFDDLEDLTNDIDLRSWDT